MKKMFLMLFVMGMLGFNWIDSVTPSADAHGVSSQPISRFIKIENETINRQSMQTGETLTIQGTLISLVDRDLRGRISIFSESINEDNTWEMLARDPPKNVFDIPGNTVVEYSLSAKALETGIFHVHTQINLAEVGQGLGLGQTVVVEGESITKPVSFTNIAYQLIPIGVGCVIIIALAGYYVWRKRK